MTNITTLVPLYCNPLLSNHSPKSVEKKSLSYKCVVLRKQVWAEASCLMMLHTISLRVSDHLWTSAAAALSDAYNGTLWAQRLTSLLHEASRTLTFRGWNVPQTLQLLMLVIHTAFNPQMDCETKMSLWPAHVKHPEKQNAVSHTGQFSCGFPSLSVCTERRYVIQVSSCHAKTSWDSFKCSQLTRLK